MFSGSVIAEERSSTIQAKKTTILEPVKHGEVVLKSNIKAEVNSLAMIPSDEGQLVSFVLTVHNNSNAELNFVDYWLELGLKDGTQFTINTIDKQINTIAAKSSKDIRFYGQVGASVKSSELVIKLIEWNFDFANYKRVLGEVTIPNSYDQVTPINFSRKISAGETRISLGVERSNIGKSEKYHRPDIKINIKNEGKRAIDLPEYEVSIMTKNGLLYPLQGLNLSDRTISPLSEKEFQLTASIPIEADERDWKLVLIMPANEGQTKIPVAIFDLPIQKLEQGGDLGKYYTFSTKDGVYDIKLDSVNRLPIEDHDLIVANMSLLNTGENSIPLPSLTGQFTFNEYIEQTGTVSSNDKIISLAPKQSINIQAVTKIPYTLEINELDITLQLVDSESNSMDNLDLVKFSHNDDFSEVPMVRSGQIYTVNDIGYRSELSIRNSLTFEGSNANIIAAQIQMNNLERRLTDLMKYAGYFESLDGTVYQAEIQSVSEKLSPSGTAVVYAWASVPKDVKIDELSLVVGKAVEEIKGEQSQLMGYVNPNKFELPSENTAQTHLSDIDLYPYTLTINKIATQIRFDLSQVILTLDYKLEQDLLAKSSMTEPKIVVELVDNSKNAVFSKELGIIGLGEAESTTSIKVGEHQWQDSWTDHDLVMQIQALKDFDLNIYAQFQPGYKKLLSTESFPWLVSRTINRE